MPEANSNAQIPPVSVTNKQQPAAPIQIRVTTLEHQQKALVNDVDALRSQRFLLGRDENHPVYTKQVSDNGGVLGRVVSDPVAFVTLGLVVVTLVLALIPMYLRHRDIGDRKKAARMQIRAILQMFAIGIQGFVTKPDLPIAAVEVSWDELSAELFRNEVAQSVKDVDLLAALYREVLRVRAHVRIVEAAQERLRKFTQEATEEGVPSRDDSDPGKAAFNEKVDAVRESIRKKSTEVAADLLELAERFEDGKRSRTKKADSR